MRILEDGHSPMYTAHKLMTMMFIIAAPTSTKYIVPRLSAGNKKCFKQQLSNIAASLAITL